MLGTPASGNLANCTFPTLNQNTSGTAANLSGTPTLPTGTTLVAPVLGTPASGALDNCVSNTEVDNNSTTQLATTAFAKSQDAVLARLPDQAVNMTAAASGSSGITVADNDNIDFGTGNFTLVWRGSLPDWTPAVNLYLFNKFTAGDHGYDSFIDTSGKINLQCDYGATFATYTSITCPPLTDNTNHILIISVIRETSVILGSVSFYIDGILFETITKSTSSTPGNVNNSLALYIMGDNLTRTAGTCSFAATYNRALTAAEVLDLYRNGISYSDKWGSQTSLVTGDNSTFASDTGFWTKSVAGITITSGVCRYNAVGTNEALYANFTVIGTKYRVTYTLSGYSTGAIFVASNGGGGSCPSHSGNGTYVDEFVATSIYLMVYSLGTTTVDIDNITIHKVGATLALEPEGIQNDKWYDSSSNALNATYPTAGWSLTRYIHKPQDVYAYGVKWDTSQSSPILTKGIVVNGVFIPTNYTSYPIQSQMKRCVKSPLGAKVYNLSSTNSIYKENLTTPLRSGTATSTSAGKLVDTEADFTTAGVAIGHWVHNTTTNITTQVTAVDSATILSVKLDRFVSGNAYSIGTANPQADGAVMVEVPACQYIMCTDGVYKYFLISEGSFNFKKSDSTIVTSDYHPWFAEDGMFRPYQYWGAFESVWWDADGGGYKNHDGAIITATGDKAVSMPGFQPLTYQTRPEMRSLHLALGASYHTESYYADEFMCLLFITEYGTLNSQIALPGYTEGTWAYANTRTTGRTMHLGNVSGTIPGVSGFDPGTYNIANSYRGIENCYGHIWKWLDGINFNSQLIYLNNNPATWAEDTATNYINTGLSLPASGYQKYFHSGLMLPSTIGADSATYVTDYVWSAAGWVALFSGGSLDDVALAGVFSRYAFNAGSARGANLGSRSAAV